VRSSIQFHRRLREREDADEEQRHHRSKNHPAPHRMRGDGVDFVGGRRTKPRPADCTTSAASRPIES